MVRLLEESRGIQMPKHGLFAGNCHNVAFRVDALATCPDISDIALRLCETGHFFGSHLRSRTSFPPYLPRGQKTSDTVTQKGVPNPQKEFLSRSRFWKQSHQPRPRAELGSAPAVSAATLNNAMPLQVALT